MRSGTGRSASKDIRDGGEHDGVSRMDQTLIDYPKALDA